MKNLILLVLTWVLLTSGCAGFKENHFKGEIIGVYNYSVPESRVCNWLSILPEGNFFYSSSSGLSGFDVFGKWELENGDLLLYLDHLFDKSPGSRIHQSNLGEGNNIIFYIFNEKNELLPGAILYALNHPKINGIADVNGEIEIPQKDIKDRSFNVSYLNNEYEFTINDDSDFVKIYLSIQPMWDFYHFFEYAKFKSLERKIVTEYNGEEWEWRKVKTY